ncbi:hypothetical protein EDB84DRAFT_1444976, partial [Lactarius hengduanensis]
DDGDSSDDNRAPAPRSGRTFKPIELAKPTHLRFYSGIWRDVLIAAKTYNRLVIHAEGKLPFPERNRNGLRSAHGCILEAIGHLENGELARFDDPIYCTYKHDMIILVLNDGSTYRGRMKNVAREVVKKCFSKELEPRLDFGHNCEQEQVISEAVQAIIRGSRFLRRPELDENQRTENFAHPAIIELCKRFYYSSKSDCLSNLFPDHFARLPVSALAMACTCVPIQFTGRVYEPVYVAMMDLIKETMRNEYHGRKLLALLKRIAKKGVNRTRLDAATLPPLPLLSTLIEFSWPCGVGYWYRTEYERVWKPETEKPESPIFRAGFYFPQSARYAHNTIVLQDATGTTVELW